MGWAAYDDNKGDGWVFLLGIIIVLIIFFLATYGIYLFVDSF